MLHLPDAPAEVVPTLAVLVVGERVRGCWSAAQLGRVARAAALLLLLEIVVDLLIRFFDLLSEDFFDFSWLVVRSWREVLDSQL